MLAIGGRRARRRRGPCTQPRAPRSPGASGRIGWYLYSACAGTRSARAGRTRRTLAPATARDVESRSGGGMVPAGGGGGASACGGRCRRASPGARHLLLELRLVDDASDEADDAGAGKTPALIPSSSWPSRSSAASRRRRRRTCRARGRGAAGDDRREVGSKRAPSASESRGKRGSPRGVKVIRGLGRGE